MIKLSQHPVTTTRNGSDSIHLCCGVDAPSGLGFTANAFMAIVSVCQTVGRHGLSSATSIAVSMSCITAVPPLLLANTSCCLLGIEDSGQEKQQLGHHLDMDPVALLLLHLMFGDLSCGYFRVALGS